MYVYSTYFLAVEFSITINFNGFVCWLCFVYFSLFVVECKLWHQFGSLEYIQRKQKTDDGTGEENTVYAILLNNGDYGVESDFESRK